MRHASRPAKVFKFKASFQKTASPDCLVHGLVHGQAHGQKYGQTHWSKYENARPKNLHRRADSDLIFACVSLMVLLLFAAADTAFRF